ncbi:37S ribosomal protein S9, mitochondrial [Aspergillus terreus]|uniref:37S ribosomal protein S9, mitochondrial n=1 Tax=Aspergillus terreus TaxID=33178 RepID=A0A5M3Z6K4_ASPTE|nr:hypothetical protein ATETN484_0008014400 [Aspergillus terreus]GFF16335.1 37S ribosomal protein S9, mitochondrial [Aspergillus terreus]
MDGDPRGMKQHYDQPRLATRAGMARRTASRPSRPSERFRGSGGQPPTRGDGRSRMPAYVDYGYTDTSFPDASLQGDDLQHYAPTLRDLPRQQQQVQQPFAPYDSEIVYNINQQAPTQTPYEVVSSYGSARQSAAMEALSSQFGVPQYFPPNDPTAAGDPALGSSYLNSHLSLSAYNQPGPIGRSTATQPFPATIAEMPPGGTAARLEPASPSHPQQQEPPSSSQEVFEPANLSEAYGQFQRALRGTFDQTRIGRLVEASRSLLEISEWLVTNARDLGILRDDQVSLSDRLQLWNDFNICWLAVCQKQKDMTEELLQTGRQPPHTSLLSVDVMENLGKELIQLCDRIEQHGLVDYEMGVWEEEILSVLSQCLDLMESRPDTLRGHTTTTTSRP